MDSLLDRVADVEPLAELSQFRLDLHACLTARATIASPDGQALACGTHRGPITGSSPTSSGPTGSGWTVQVTAEPIATAHCDHRNREDGYEPSPALQRLVRARSATCAGPGCRRSATRCDLESGGPGESH
jgi:hypothetical protein